MARDWLIKSDLINRRGLWIPWKIELSEEAEADILLAGWAAHDFYKSEISGLGRVQTRDNGIFFIPEIIIPVQRCSIAGTTILGEIMDEAFQELEAAGKNPLEYNFWWHSHVKGSARFSSTDDFMIDQRLRTMMTSVHARYLSQNEVIPDEVVSGPFFSLVGNVYRHMKARCDFLYRCGEEYRQGTFVIPVLRPLEILPAMEQNRILIGRAPAITAFVRQRVSREPPLRPDRVKENQGDEDD
ncbi:MAG: hypothetical protein Q8L57_01490 [bacterium]|nr:hypothetical protein [bacterium]